MKSGGGPAMSSKSINPQEFITKSNAEYNNEDSLLPSTTAHDSSVKNDRVTSMKMTSGIPR